MANEIPEDQYKEFLQAADDGAQYLWRFRKDPCGDWVCIRMDHPMLEAHGETKAIALAYLTEALAATEALQK